MKNLFLILFLFASILITFEGNILAAETTAKTDANPPQIATAKPILDQPQLKVDRMTPISIQLEGTDSLGSKLALRLKERLNSSNLFKLKGIDEDQNEPRLILQLASRAEFPSRPAIGSIYSICWVFKEGRGYLPYLLKHDLGLIQSDQVDGLVNTILELTDGIASRYANFWHKKP